MMKDFPQASEGAEPESNLTLSASEVKPLSNYCIAILKWSSNISARGGQSGFY